MTAHGGIRNFHVPLSLELHRRLHAAARRAERPATSLVREAIEEHLASLDRRALGEEIRRYAEAHAGGAADLDAELESCGVSELLRLTEEEGE